MTTSVYQAVIDEHGDVFPGLDAPMPQASGPGLAGNGDGDPLAGLVYVTDYRAEEEWGARDLRTALTGTDPRRFQMTKRARHHVGVFTDVNGLVLAVGPDYAAEQTLAWGDPVGHARRGARPGTPGYATRWTSSLNHVQGAPTGLRGETLPQLQNRARALGIAPMPRRKDDLLAAIEAHPTYHADRKWPHSWPGWFHDGDNLVLRADIGPAATIIRRLIAAVEAGTLGVGSGSGPFSTGLFLYDTRDETPALRTEREESFDFHDRHMKTATRLQAELEKDYRVSVLGRPTLTARHAKTEPELHFWFSGTPLRGGKRTLGWFTTAELEARDFSAYDNR